MPMPQLIGWFDRCLSSVWQSRFLMMICGALFPLAFAPFECWPVAFFSSTLLILALTRSSRLSPFKLGFYWGIGAYLVGASWVYVSIHEFGFVPVFGALILTVIFALYLALYKGLMAFLIVKLTGLSHQLMIVLIAPTLWVFCEYLQSIVFNGFPWLLIGYSQIDSPLGALATVLGVYGVSWFTVLFCTVLACWLISPKSKKVFSVLAVASSFVLAVVVYDANLGGKTLPEKTMDIGLVQPNIPQAKKWDKRYFGQIVNVLISETEPLWGADLIVWPEGAIPAFKHQVTDILRDLELKAQENNSELVLGLPEYQQQSERSFVSLISVGNSPHVYHKQVLVPFGEYVPLEEWLRGLIRFLDLPMSGFTPAMSQQQPMDFDDFSLIPAICYEIVYPWVVRDLSNKVKPEQLQMIATVSNDAWFGDSFGPYQHMEMARMRAKELGIPLIRSTNDGITAFVDHRGKILKQLPRYQQASLRYQLPVVNQATLFRRWGHWGIVGIILFSMGMIFLSVWLKKDQ